MKSAGNIDFLRYYRMPKDFVGPQRADVLFAMGERMSEVGSCGYLFAAGSAAAESGIAATHLPTALRHERIEFADRAWRDAQDAFIYKNNRKGWTESKLLTMPDRIEMQRLYIALYHELIDGEVQDVSVGRLHHDLLSLGKANLSFIRQAETADEDMAYAGRLGLNTEIGTLLTMTRLVCPSLFPIPATSRADHGGSFPAQTHDVRLVQQSWGTIRWCVPYEVKSNNSGRADHYDSAFVRGKVELLMPSCTDPLDLMEYMDQEETGVISPGHLGELNEITSRVLRLAQNYRQRQKMAELVLDVA